MRPNELKTWSLVMKYASVIVTFNRKEKLVGALRCLLEQTLKPQKVFVIDNCSTDGTTDLLKKEGLLDNPRVDYQKMKKNYGGSGGFYYGIKKAMDHADLFDYLSISDDDAFYEKDYFELMSKATKKYPECKAFCGTVLYEDGTVQTDHRRKVVNSKWVKELEIPASQYKNNFYVDTFSFVGCLISKEILRQIGLPNKDYFIYYDDTEYSLRVRELTKVINVSAARIIHKTPKKNTAIVNIGWKNYYGIRNQILMRKSHSHWRLLNLYLLWHQLKFDLHVLHAAEYKGIRRKALYVYNQGFKDGLRGISGKRSEFLPGKKIQY